MAPHSCPECGCGAVMTDSSRTTTGRRRRFHCLSTICGNRWTEWEGGRPEPPAPPKFTAKERRILAVRERRLTTDQVRLILTRLDVSGRKLALLLGVRRQTATNVRLGYRYAHVLPHLPRQQPGAAKQLCTTCRYWSGERCREGWPDPEQEGPEFARWCDDYQRKCQ